MFGATASPDWYRERDRMLSSHHQDGLDACPKFKPTFLVGRRNTASFKYYDRPGNQQFFGFVQISKHWYGDRFVSVLFVWGDQQFLRKCVNKNYKTTYTNTKKIFILHGSAHTQIPKLKKKLSLRKIKIHKYLCLKVIKVRKIITNAFHVFVN